MSARVCSSRTMGGVVPSPDMPGGETLTGYTSNIRTVARGKHFLVNEKRLTTA
jgi:lysozyme family protein